MLYTVRTYESIFCFFSCVKTWREKHTILRVQSDLDRGFTTGVKRLQRLIVRLQNNLSAEYHCLLPDECVLSSLTSLRWLQQVGTGLNDFELLRAQHHRALQLDSWLRIAVVCSSAANASWRHGHVVL